MWTASNDCNMLFLLETRTALLGLALARHIHYTMNSTGNYRAVPTSTVQAVISCSVTHVKKDDLSRCFGKDATTISIVVTLLGYTK